MRPVQLERGDEVGHGIGEAVHAEVLERVRRAATAGHVPHDDVELVGEPVELRPPLAPVAPPTVEEQQWLTGPRTSVRERAPADLDVTDLHSPHDPVAGTVVTAGYSYVPSSAARFGR